MVKSMTGFGNASNDISGTAVTVEIKSLNSKFLEMALRLPSMYRDKELELRAELGKLIERGKVDVSINIGNGASDISRKSNINKEIFKAYYEELKLLRDELNISDQLILETVIKLPQVLGNDKTEGDEEQWKAINVLLKEAVEKFNSFREQEGKVIEVELTLRINNILKLLIEAEKFEKGRIENIRERLHKNIAEIKEATNIDENRFEQELIFYVEKFDITEEKLRLRSHCNYFIESLKSKEANGKKLGFITQELGREINTLGSKANDASMQRAVVEMKDELEKLKEQLANVL